MNDKLLDSFLSSPDDELHNWIRTQQVHLDISFLEAIRLHAQQISLEGDLPTALYILDF